MDLDAALTLLARVPNAPLDLAELSLQLARDEYPDIDVEAYLSELAGMAREAHGYIAGPLEKRVTGLCRYLFHEMGFRGNVDHYYDPRNSYLNEVMDRRTGIPITLSTMAIAIGARIGLEIVGIGLPGHFIAKAVEGAKEVLFDPFHGGRLLAPQDCEYLVEQATKRPFHASPELLAATPLAAIVVRMLSNLKAIYLKADDFARALRVISRLRQVDPEDAVSRRDLGICLWRTGHPGQAIDHLAAYLTASVKPADAETIRDMLEQARAEVARWN